MKEQNSRWVGRGWSPQVADEFPRFQWPDGSVYPTDAILAGLIMFMDDADFESFRGRHLLFFADCRDPAFRATINELLSAVSAAYERAVTPIQIEVTFNSYGAQGSAAFGESVDRIDSPFRLGQLVVTDFFALLYRLLVISDIHDRRRVYNLSKNLHSLLDGLKSADKSVHLIKNRQGDRISHLTWYFPYFEWIVSSALNEELDGVSRWLRKQIRAWLETSANGSVHPTCAFCGKVYPHRFRQGKQAYLPYCSSCKSQYSRHIPAL